MDPFLFYCFFATVDISRSEYCHVHILVKLRITGDEESGRKGADKSDGFPIVRGLVSVQPRKSAEGVLGVLTSYSSKMFALN